LTSTDQQIFERAIASFQAGALDEAGRGFAEFLRRNPKHFAALNLYGILLTRMARYGEAEGVMRRAIAVDSRSDATFYNYGIILKALDRPQEAHEAFSKAIAINPSILESWNNRGTVLNDLKRYRDAIGDFEKAIALSPHYVEAHYNMGRSLAELGEFDRALVAYDAALKLRPDFSEALCNRGDALHVLRRFEEALASYARALTVRPNYAEALSNRGNTLSELKRYDEALASYERSLAVRPDHADTLYNHGVMFFALKRYDEALASFDRALAVRPNDANTLYNQGVLFFTRKQYHEALVNYERALAIKPDIKLLPGRRLHTKMFICDWSEFDSECTHLIADIRGGRPAATPFDFLSIPSSASDQQKCAESYVGQEFPASTRRPWQGERYAHDRIRVAYVSADFREHPVAHLLAGLFEQHDRARFETIAISFGPNDGSEMRARLQGIFDRFIDVCDKTDADAERLLRELEIDIAIDLMGFTTECRPGILVHRPAPIQVNYLGFAGTMGAGHIDYIIGDRCVIPEHQQPQFSEHVVYLPDTYFPYDSKQQVSQYAPTRAEQGLPETGFVFCAFNNTYKLTPQLFDIWMRLLRAMEGSVLWLSQANDTAVRNLRREAEVRGVDASRLRFAPRVAQLEEHLARLRLADVFLDTLPYNAHTTASDALWAGLPVLTCRGETFAGRVAASLLNAVGLPELVTDNLADYEALALKLAREPAVLAEIKAKLARNRGSYPLFDTARFTRHIEAAYTTMWEIWQRGEAPKSFSVDLL
jgi:predicted O-linked N-acetylglucosamine transferase (SPINDLY family)